MEKPEYCAVIRTIGRAGRMYQRLLDSLASQTIPPKKILVYLAEGFDKPMETIGTEQIVRVPKGMVAQRALPYDEVDTEWMLMLDDDIDIAHDGVERMFQGLKDCSADVCAVDALPHHTIPLLQKIVMASMLSSIPRIGGKKRGYRVSCTGSDVYNPAPSGDFALSTTNAGMAFICRKTDFLAIHFEEDLWLDDSPYAIPDDKVMFFKMHLAGLKILTHYNSGFTHLDAATSVTGERAAKIAYSHARNNKIFYELYVRPNLPVWKKPLATILRLYQQCAAFIYNTLRDRENTEMRRKGLRDAKEFLKLKKI